MAAWLPEFDLFVFFRRGLALVCGIYATVVTAQSLWRWCVYLSGQDRQTSLMRRYLLVQLLRLRARRFLFELLQIVGLAVASMAVFWLHTKL